MWVQLKHAEKTLLYKCIIHHQKLCFIITDLKRIWEKNISKEEFVRLIINENQFLEGSLNETILNMALEKMAQETEGWIKSVHWNIDEDKTHLRYTFKKLKEPITFKVNLILDLGNAEKFFEYVTWPLLETFKEMRKANCELKSIIKIKDEEIEKYKSKGATLNIEYLITDKFDPTTFNNKYPTYDRNIKSMEEMLRMEVAEEQETTQKRPAHDLDQPSQNRDDKIKVDMKTLKMDLDIDNINNKEANELKNGESSTSTAAQDSFKNSAVKDEMKLNSTESYTNIRKKRKLHKTNF